MFLGALLRRVADNPDGPAVITVDRRIGNAELWSESAALAEWLVRQGFAPGQTVGITVRDEYRNFVAMLGATIAGLPHVGLATFDPPAYRSAIAGRLGLAAVLVDKPENGLPGFATVALDAELPPGRDSVPRSRPGDDDVCIYVTTSGTTGLPKIVPLSHRQLHLQGITFQGTPHPETLYRPSSIEFSSSRKQRLYCLSYGGTNVFVDPQRNDVVETCSRLPVTELGISAAQARALVDRPLADMRLPDATGIRIVGSPVPQPLRRDIAERLSPRLSVGFGATEFGAVATALPGDHDRHPATVGRIHAGVDLAIVDEDDQPVPPGKSGRIRLRSAGMATHYHDDDVANAAAFRNGWFYSGDIGHLGEAGDLRFDGRADDMMILASINIFPAEIERVVEQLPGVVECAAFAMKSGEFGDVPLLAVVTDGTLRSESILAEARRALGLRAPRKVFIVDKLPRNSAGKLQRNLLRDIAGPATVA